MYKYSWKATLMTFGMMGVGKIAWAAEENIVQEGGGSQPFPDWIIAVSSVVIFVLGLIFMFFLLKRGFDKTNRDIRNLREELANQKSLLARLNKRIDDMPEGPVQSTFVKEQYAESPVKQTASPLMQPKPMPVQAQNIPEPKPNLSEKLRQKSLEFAEEYNRIQTITGMGAREAKLEFQRKYKLCGFVCINSTERINHPEKEPQFQLRDSLLDSAIWGFEIGNFYVVAPNPRQYVGDDHNYGGMKELFESNFQPGCTYNKIKINNVAIMTHNLQIHKQGSLQLS